MPPARYQWAVLVATLATSVPAHGQLIAPDHTVVLVLENRTFGQMLGAADAPYLNSLIPQGGLLTNYFAVTHPSQPNYLAMFSGSTQGVIDNTTPTVLPFTSPNLGAQLLNSGRSFVGYSEGLPFVGYTGDNAGGTSGYYRKHNPWVNWQQVGAGPHPTNTLPSLVNQPFSAFPTDYATLPSVSFVVPTQANDMHDGSTATGDAWVAANLGGYIQWARTHNSMFVVTFDEDDGSDNNHIFTLFVGAGVLPGSSSSSVYSHYHLLATLQDMYSLPRTGGSDGLPAISGIFVPVPEASSWAMTAFGGVLTGLASIRGRFRAWVAKPG
ncbi:MAG: alkaline phosphatase family protein [Gemmataceae bacterium]